MSDKPSKIEPFLNLTAALFLLGAIGHVFGWLPEAWKFVQGAPAQFQQNMAAIKPDRGAAALPDPSAPPLVAAAEAAAPTAAPAPAASPIAPPDSAKKDCQGAVLSSVTPFAVDQYAKLRAVVGTEKSINPGNRLADVVGIIGSPVCQLPPYVAEAGFPLDRYRFIGTVDGSLLQLTVAFRGAEVVAYSLAPLK